MNDPFQDKTHLIDFAKNFIASIADEYLIETGGSYHDLTEAEKTAYMIEKEYIVLDDDHEEEEE